MNLIYIIFAFAAGSSIFLSLRFILNITKVNIIANQWLGAFYFCLAATFGQLFIHSAGLLNQATFLVHILELTNWAVLPCFYIAILYYVNPVKKSRWLLLHFFPAFGFLLFSLFFMTNRLFSVSGKLPDLPSTVPLFVRHFFKVQVVAYWLLSFRQLLIHSKFWETSGYTYQSFADLENQVVVMLINAISREDIIKWLMWNDRNGIYDDNQSLKELGNTMFREEGLEIMLRQIEEGRGSAKVFKRA